MVVFTTNAQNLVMNPSFEEYWQCPTQAANSDDCKYVFDPQCILEPIPCISTSDYFNSCALVGSNVSVPYSHAGYQHPINGDGYLGILNHDTTGYREYVQLKLHEPLVAGVEYPFSFFVNLSNNSNVAIDAIGVKFVFDSLRVTNQYLWEIMDSDWQNDSGNFITDTLAWTKLAGVFKAEGGEQWMIIGVFYPEKIIPSMIVNSSSTPAWEHLFYYYVDAVSVEAKPIVIPNVFTPNNDGLNDIWKPDIGSLKELKVLNRWGNVVFEAYDNSTGWNGENQQGISCEEGTYFYVLRMDQETKSGFVSLLR